MNDAEAEKILHLLSVSRYDVAFPYAIYAKLESYDPFGPLAPKIREAMFRIRTHIAQQLEKQSKKLLNAEIAVKLSSYLAILDKSSAHNKLYNLRRSIAPYLSRFDYEHDLTEVDDSVDISANIAVWQAISEEFSLLCFEDNKKVAGFEEFSGFFAALGPNYIGEIIDLANVESTQNLSKKTPSTDKDDNRRRYISEMNDVLGQISIQLWHEYQKQNLIYIGSTTSDTVPTVKKHKSISFNKNTFSNKDVLTSSIDTVVCSRSSDIELVAQRTQIKSKAKDIWNDIYAWDDKLTKKYPLLYPAAKSMTVAVSTGMIGSMAYSGYKLGKAVKKSFNNYKLNADKTKYHSYFRYITAKENFNEAADLGKSATLLLVSSIFVGATIAENGLSVATGLTGQVSQHGFGGLPSVGHASSGVFEKIQHINVSSLGKSLISNSRVLASTTIGAFAGLATSLNSGLQQRRAERELDNLLKQYGSSKFPKNKQMCKWRSSDPAKYYSIVLWLNSIKLSPEKKRLLDQKSLLITQKRQEKQKRGWSAGLGTIFGLGAAGAIGSIRSDIAVNDNEVTQIPPASLNKLISQEKISLPADEQPAKSTCHRSYYLSKAKQLTIDNDEITVGKKLRQLGWHEDSKNIPSSQDYAASEDVSSNKNNGSDEHKSYYKKSVNLVTTDGYTQTPYGTSYRIDDNGDIIFKGKLPDEATASKIEAQAYAEIKQDVLNGEKIGTGEYTFFNGYACYADDSNIPTNDENFAFTDLDNDNQQIDFETKQERIIQYKNKILSSVNTRQSQDYDDIYYDPRSQAGAPEPVTYEQTENVIDKPVTAVLSIRRVFDRDYDDFASPSYDSCHDTEELAISKPRRNISIHDDIYFDPNRDKIPTSDTEGYADNGGSVTIRQLQYY